MKYDFTAILERKGQDALAVDLLPIPNAPVQEGFSLIPMWVADMNFKTCPSILDQLHERVDKAHFGYFAYPKEWFEAIIRWQKTRNQVDLTPEQVGYENGVLGGVSSVLHAFTQPGEPVLLQTPAYIGFSHVLDDTGRKAVYSPLIKDESGIWRMDYKDMEEKIVQNRIHTVIFCSPHNPSGRVWEKEEIEKAYEIFRKHDCLVIADEIWSDLILPGSKHIPAWSVNEDAKSRTISLYSPSKTFSLAGLVGSYHVISNPTLRHKVRRAASAAHYNNGNVLSVHGLMGAYTKEGEQWVDELMQVIETNMELAQNYFSSLEGISFSKPQGTYMLYLDLSNYLQKTGKSLDEVLQAGQSVGVLWQDGRPFLNDNTIRLNLALPTEQVKEALKRLDEHVFSK